MPVKQTLSSAKGHVTRHYRRVMPNKKSHRVAIWVAILSYTAITLVQLLYPLNRALPLATMFGQNVGGKTHTELAALVTQKFQDTKVELSANGKKAIFTLTSVGAEVLTEASVLQAENYPIWQRYIPLSILWQPAQVHSHEVHYAKKVLDNFAAKQSKQFVSKPVNARLSIEKGHLTAADDVSGWTITADALAAVLRQATMKLGEVNRITLPMQEVRAATTAADFTEVKALAQAALQRTVTITADERVFTPSAAERASWLLIGQDAKKQPVLQFDDKKFNAYLDTIDAKVGRAPGYTEVTITNGIETARIPGATGRALTREALVAQARTWIVQGGASSQLVATFHDVAPVVRYNKRYTSTQAGLQAYINDMATQMDVHIAIQQVDGGKWYASVRSGDSIPSASTYKLYVAKWLFTEMDKGHVKWTDPILDTNVTTCFDRMTIASTNPCAVEWLARAGRDNVNNFVWNLGFSHGTTFTSPEANHTTANDLLKYMIGLNNGTLVGGTYRDKLLHNLSVHPYRYGIPTGSAGTVQDKVGFLWDYVHDAAIVHHPKGTYVMVIMTRGQSYATIANLTREIERIMYP